MPVTPRPWSGFNSQDERDHPWLFKCDKPQCLWVTAHATQEYAEKVMAEHECPRFTPIKTGNMMAEGLEFIKIVWDEMDTLVDHLFSKKDSLGIPVSPEDLLVVKGTLIGMSRVVSHWMPESLDSSDKISRELKKRWRERGDGKMPNTEGVEYRAYPKAKVETSPIPNLHEEVIRSIVQSLTRKLPVDLICITYGVTSADVTQIKRAYAL